MGRDDDAAAPADCLTLVMPLKARAGMTRHDFYEYWLNAHVTLPARFPGIDSIYLHCVSFDDDGDDGATWPRLPGVSHRPPAEDEFEGVPEATFVTMEGLAEFQAASKVQMDDGINFLQELIAYASIADNTTTFSDHTENPAPDGHDSFVRHLLFLHRRDEIPVSEFRSFVADTLAPKIAASPDVLKVRRHLFEEVETTLDHPGVRQARPLNRQYQAALEVVIADQAALDRFKTGKEWTDLKGQVTTHCEAVHAARVSRCITTKYQGTITLAGVRGVAVADVIRRWSADSQLDDEVSALFLNTPAHVLVQNRKGIQEVTTEEMVRELWDRQQISDVMLRFGRGLDLHDWDMYAATLTDPFEVNFFDLTGRPSAVTTPKVWAEFARACLERLVVMHQYSNFHINLHGDEADGVFYHISRHRFPNRFGDDHYTQYGWYENSFRRTGDGWKISKLKHTFQWCDGNPTLIDVTDPAWQEAAAAVFGTD